VTRSSTLASVLQILRRTGQPSRCAPAWSAYELSSARRPDGTGCQEYDTRVVGTIGQNRPRHHFHPVTV
jgi:hypothetical protein